MKPTKRSGRGIISLALSLLTLALVATPAQAVGPPLATSTSFSAVTETSATLEARLDPNLAATHYHFEYVDQATFKASGFAAASKAPVPDASIPAQVSGKGDVAEKSNTIVNVNVTASAGAFAPGQTISGAGIPLGTTIVAVGQGSLQISNPATATSKEAVLTASGPQPVSVAVSGLQGGTDYHFRLFAENSKGKDEGPEATFTTLSPPPSFPSCPNDPFRSGEFAPLGRPSASLPDCRAYEQATPVGKDGNDAFGQVGFLKASSAGDAVTYMSSSGIPGGEGAQALPAYLASRGAGSWSSYGLLPPASTGERANVLGWLPDFSQSFSQAVQQDPSPRKAFFIRHGGGVPQRITPYLAMEDNFAYAGASADGSQILFTAPVRLPASPNAGDPLLPGSVEGATNVYVFDETSGQVSLAARMNEIGETEALLAKGATPGANVDNYLQDQRAVAADGSLYFTAKSSGQLYLRLHPAQPQSPLNPEGECTDPALACTIHVSATQKTNGTGGGADPAGPQPAKFQAASADGRVAYFTSSEKLTDDANTGPEQPPAQIGRATLHGEGSADGVKEHFLPAHAGGLTVSPDGEYIYWADSVGGTIGRAELNGDGEPTNPEPAFITPGPIKCAELSPGVFEEVESEPRYVAVDGEFVYWTNTGCRDAQGRPLDGGGTIGRVAIAAPTNPDPEFITGASNPQGIAVSATHLYWADWGTTQETKAISRATRAGGTAELSFFEPKGNVVPIGVAVDATHVYFSVNEFNNDDGGIWRLPLNGGEVDKSLFIGKAGVRGVAVDSQHAYWATQGEGAIGRANLDLEGTSKNNELLTPQGTLLGLATDGTHLYWSVNGEATSNPGNDLYRFRADGSGSCQSAGGCLDDLSVDSAALNGAEVRGVLGASADGSSVYFAANGDLDGPGEAQAGNCTGTFDDANGSCNLYLWHEGTIVFLARLDNGNAGSGADALDWLPTPKNLFSTNSYVPKTSVLSGDGQTLIFRSRAKLTGYDNHGVPEYYRFHLGESGLDCITCNPTGAAPAHEPALTSIKFPAINPAFSIAAVATRNLSADGDRAFFETEEALVGSDANGVRDVYEWEAPGTGSCVEGGPAFSARDGGCLYRISPPGAGSPSYFDDASASGGDVFFFTRTALVGQDQDQLVDVYDARVGGGLADQNPLAEPECEGDGCKPTPTEPPSQATPATAGFTGPPNPPGKPKPPKHCRHGWVRRHGHCVKRHRRHHHPKPRQNPDGRFR